MTAATRALGGPRVGAETRPVSTAVCAPFQRRQVQLKPRKGSAARMPKRPPPRTGAPPGAEQASPGVRPGHRPSPTSLPLRAVRGPRLTPKPWARRAVQAQTRVPAAAAEVPPVGVPGRSPHAGAPQPTGPVAGTQGRGKRRAAKGAVAAAVAVGGGRGAVAATAVEEPTPPTLTGVLAPVEAAGHLRDGFPTRVEVPGAIGAIAGVVVAATVVASPVRPWGG